jgi:hypothetical protein
MPQAHSLCGVKLRCCNAQLTQLHAAALETRRSTTHMLGSCLQTLLYHLLQQQLRLANHSRAAQVQLTKLPALAVLKLLCKQHWLCYCFCWCCCNCSAAACVDAEELLPSRDLVIDTTSRSAF